MPPKRRAFQRPLGERRYRKLFVIAAEGVKTEPHYFAIFNGQHSMIMVKCLKGRNDSAPRHVLKRMEDYLRQEDLRDSDTLGLRDPDGAQTHFWVVAKGEGVDVGA